MKRKERIILKLLQIVRKILSLVYYLLLFLILLFLFQKITLNTNSIFNGGFFIFIVNIVLLVIYGNIKNRRIRSEIIYQILLGCLFILLLFLNSNLHLSGIIYFAYMFSYFFLIRQYIRKSIIFTKYFIFCFNLLEFCVLSLFVVYFLKCFFSNTYNKHRIISDCEIGLYSISLVVVYLMLAKFGNYLSFWIINNYLRVIKYSNRREFLLVTSTLNEVSDKYYCRFTFQKKNPLFGHYNVIFNKSECKDEFDYEDELIINVNEGDILFNEIRKKITTKVIDTKLFLDSSLTIDRLASVIDFPEPIVRKYFKKSSSKSFKQYINRLRIEYAVMIMKDQKDLISIEELSIMSGFNNRISFYRSFVNVYGFPPSEIK